MYQFKELHTLDFSKVNYINEVHQIIKDELDFPDYYGMNWDAFWDCLTDMVEEPFIRLKIQYTHMPLRFLHVLERHIGNERIL